MDAQFSRTLHDRMVYFTNDINSDKLLATQAEIQAAQQIATQVCSKEKLERRRNHLVFNI